MKAAGHVGPARQQRPQGRDVDVHPSGAGRNEPRARVRRPTVASSADLVVHVGTEPCGQRRLREVVRFPGDTEGSVVETADVFAAGDGRRVCADAYLRHADRFR